jgi:hypothetical protein
VTSTPSVQPTSSSHYTIPYKALIYSHLTHIPLFAFAFPYTARSPRFSRGHQSRSPEETNMGIRSPQNRDTMSLSKTTSSSAATAHQAAETMCVLTPYQLTCADPFGEHLCGSGYYFHARTTCHRTPACTKFYTAPIMLDTSCQTCEKPTRYFVRE